MSFPRYGKYKESGVEWLGHIPSHWAAKRLRFVAEINPSKSEVSHLPADTEVSFLPMEAIGEDGRLELDRVRPLAEVQTGYTFFRDGDVAIAKITPCFENGKGAAMRDLHNGIGFGTTELIVTRPKATQTTSTYLHWLFISRPFRKAGESFMYGAGGQKRVPDDFVRDFAIGFPPLPEQRHIAAFLDHETAKIDALVEEQKRLIELLKEKRQAVISHAVTKGLNPNAPMKDSGVEWLGEVPAHWHVLPLKYFADVGNGSTPNRDRADYWCPTGFPWLSSTVVNQDEVTQADEFVTALALAECHLPRVQPPAILIGITGQGRTRGMATTLMIEATINQHIAYARPRGETIKLGYLRRLFDMAYSKLRADSEAGGSTKAAITCDQIANLRFPLPPAAEQDEVAQAIALEAVKFDALAEDATQAMSLLQERRTALISAAVTGKIDVRRAGAEASV